MKPSIFLTFVFSLLFVGLLSADNKKPHILFIAVDDLRPELNCYGAERSISPNIDRLAAMGTLYENAYVQVPVCGASRASLMLVCILLKKDLLGTALDLIDRQVISGEKVVQVRRIFQISLVGLRKMGTKHFLWERFITMQMIMSKLGM